METAAQQPPPQPAKSNILAEAQTIVTNSPPKTTSRLKQTNTPPVQVASANVNTAAVHTASPPPKTNAPVVAAPVRTNAPTQVAQEKPRTNAPPKEVVLAKAPETPIEKPAEAAEDLPPIQVVQLSNDPQIKPAVDTTLSAAAAPTNSAVLTPSNEVKPLFAPRRKEEKSTLARMNPANWFKKDENAEPAPATVKTNAEPSSPRGKTQTSTKQLAKNEGKPELKAEPLPPVRVATATTVTRPGYVPATPTVAPTPPPKVIARYPYRKNLTFNKGKRDQAERYFAEGAQAQTEKNLPGAIAAYKRAIALDPSFFNSYYNLGLAAAESRDLPLALATNEEAVALNPDSIDARYNFALTLRDAHYYTDSAFELREILGRAPDDVRAHLALGNLYSQYLDEPKLAQQHYNRVLELNPNHREAQVIREWLANAR